MPYYSRGTFSYQSEGFSGLDPMLCVGTIPKTPHFGIDHWKSLDYSVTQFWKVRLLEQVYEESENPRFTQYCK